jgi:membrane-anchored protein YejM (alkaline phosphatase superfamily)
VANIRPLESRPELQRSKLDLLKSLDAEAQNRLGPVDALESAIANYEMAFRMQAAVPGLTDISNESAATRNLYGLDAEYEPTRIFAHQCLLARRLVERGVRFIELTCPAIEGNDRWDAHSNLIKNHSENARAVDQPIAGLLTDLKSRGLLEETLIVWAGEFGRTPFAQGSDGRDHNPFGFSIWLAGAGVRGGTVYGTTDEYGYKVVENRCDIHDLHATMLHLLGVDHKRLTYRFSGRDIRLTDVYGNVLTDILT